MHFLVLKKIGGVITQRQAKYLEADKKSEEATHTLENAKVEFAKIIENAKEESQNIINDSKHQSNEQAKKIMDRALIDAGEIIIKAQGVLAVEKEKMLADFKSTLEKSVRESLVLILSSQSDKIEFDAKMLEEVSARP